jgi:hypothetical protein
MRPGWEALRVLIGAIIIIFVCAGRAEASTRIALVIGNGTYQNVPSLPNPTNDATDLSLSLGRLGFSVTTLKDARYDDIRRALIDFSSRANGAEIALIFFAGHGIQVGGENWLIPVDARLDTDVNVANETIGLQAFTHAVSNTTKLGLVILDACRSNPFVRKMQSTNLSRVVSRGFSRIEPSDNVLVAYAARDGTTASDGHGRNSPFTQSLLSNIETPGLEIRFLFANVRDDVMATTKKEQQPFVYGSLSKDPIYLQAAQPAGGAGSVNVEDELAWSFVKDTIDIALLKQFIEKYPRSRWRSDAEAKLTSLTNIDSKPPPTPLVSAPPEEAPPPAKPPVALKKSARVTRKSIEVPLSNSGNGRCFAFNGTRVCD